MSRTKGDEGGESDLGKFDFDRLVHKDETLSAIYNYWSGKRQGSQLPSRQAIDPAEIPELLPHLGLIDVEPNMSGFRYRLIGTHMVNMFGRDFTGRSLGDPLKDGTYGRFLRAYYTDAVQHCAPVFCESVFRYRGSGELRIRRLVMPLTAAPGSTAVTMLFFCNTFLRSRSRDEVVYATAIEDGPFLSENIEDIEVLVQARDERHAGMDA